MAAGSDPRIVRDQIMVLLEALDRQVAIGDRLAKASLKAVAHQHFHPYDKFRRQIDEALALLVVVEEILDRFDPEKTPALRGELARLVGALLGLYVRTVHDFFAEMVRSGVTPLGARHLFSSEPGVLAVVRKRLAPGAGLDHGRDLDLDLDLDGILEDAARMVGQIIDRAPTLPDFGAAVQVTEPEL